MAGIKKKFFFQLLYAVSQLTFPLITYPYITRKLGAEGLGLVGYVEYVSGFIITIASFGIPFFGVREIARLQDQPQKKHKLLQQLFSLHFLVSLIGCVVFVGLIKANHQQDISNKLIMLGCANILLPAFIAEWYMQGIEAFVFITVRSIILRFLGLLALLLFINSQQDYVIYYLVIVLVQATIAITNMQKIGLRNFIPTFGKPSFSFNSLSHFFLTSSIISVYVFFDIIILGWIADEKHVGYYTIAVKIVKLSLLMVLSLSVILFPRISYLKQNNHHQAVTELVQKGLQFVVVLTIPLGIAFFLLAPQIIELLAGKNFEASVLPLQILSGLPLIIGVSNLFAYQILIPFEKEKKLLVCVAITCICSLVCHYFFASALLEEGTAIATMLTEGLMTLLTGFFAFKSLPIRFPVSVFVQSMLATLPFVIIVLCCRIYVDHPLPFILISAIPGFILYGLLQLYVFKNAFITDAWNSLRKLKPEVVNG